MLILRSNHMNIAIIILLSLLISNMTTIKPSQQFEDIPSDTSPCQCSICYRFIKINRNIILKDSDVVNFTESFEKPDFGLLVFVKTDTQRWQLAITGHVIPPITNIPVHLCENHTLFFYPAENIRRLKLLRQYCWQPRLPRHMIYDSFKLFIERFRKSDPKPFIQAQVINPANKIVVIGDLHGSSKSLRILMKTLVVKKILAENSVLNPQYYLVFTGDYADRCCHGGEVWFMIIHLKILNQARVFLLKGNHESLAMAGTGEFYKEVERISYDNTQTEPQQILNDLFISLPYALLLGTELAIQESKTSHYKFLLFCHGGIDPSVILHEAMRKSIAAHKAPHQEKLINHVFSPDQSELSGLLWSDFFANRVLHDCPWNEPSYRGENLSTYNSAAAHEYIDQHTSDNPQNSYTLDAIIRGHQHIPGGISRLLETVTNGSDWAPLPHGVPEIIDHGSVYTCNSSPEGLASFGCFEDSYALIEWNNIQQQWQLTPHIEHRVPKRYAQLATQAYP